MPKNGEAYVVYVTYVHETTGEAYHEYVFATTDKDLAYRQMYNGAEKREGYKAVEIGYGISSGKLNRNDWSSGVGRLGSKGV